MVVYMEPLVYQSNTLNPKAIDSVPLVLGIATSRTKRTLNNRGPMPLYYESLYGI